MLEKILNNRILVLYFLPFCFGGLTVFSFQPFNLSFINFFLLPLFFLLLVDLLKGKHIFHITIIDKQPSMQILSERNIYSGM